MQAILELQRQLKEVQSQQSSSAHKLNDRNIVDIIRKVVEQNKIRLIYTSDGKEYLTYDQLEKEIKDLLQEHGGRINTIEIPKHIGVNYEVIEKSLEQFTKRSKVTLINGQLISSQYIDMVMEDLNDHVTDSGIVALSDLTVKHNLPLDFIKDQVSSKMEHFLPLGTTLQGNSIITQSFTERQLCKIRGILRGVTRPVALSQIASTYKIEEQKLKNTADLLLKEGYIKGKFQQGLFIPQQFTEMQEGAMKSFYSQNRYVEYAMLSKLQVPKPREFIDGLLGKDQGLHLANYFISQELVNIIEGQVTEAVKNATYLDLTLYIPSPFQDDDIIELCKQVGEQCRLLSNCQHLCSAKFIERCLEKFKPILEERALKEVKSGYKPQDQVQKKGAPQKQMKGKQKGKKGRQQQDEDLEEVKGEQDLIPDNKKITEDEISETLSQCDLPEFKDNKDEADMILMTLSEFLVGPVNQQFHMCLEEAFARVSTKQSAKSNQNLEQEVEDTFQLLQYVQKQMENTKKMYGSEREQEFEAVVIPVKVYLTKNECQTLLNKICLAQAFHNNVNVNNLALSKDQKTQTATVQNANDRKVIIKQFHKHLQQIFETLNKQVSEKNFDEFMAYLSENIKNLGVRIKQMDKKIEKLLNQKLQKQLREDLTPQAVHSNIQSDFREIFTGVLNAMMLDLGCFMNLPNEEWACKLMVNVLTNSGLEQSERKKNDLVELLHIYSRYHQASKESDNSSLSQQMKEQREANIERVLEVFHQVDEKE